MSQLKIATLRGAKTEQLISEAIKPGLRFAPIFFYFFLFELSLSQKLGV